MGVLLFSIMLAGATPASAKGKSKGPDISKFYDFSEQLIEGEIHRPSYTYIEGAHTPAKFECDEFTDKGDMEGWTACMCKLSFKPGSPTLPECEKYLTPEQLAAQAQPEAKLTREVTKDFATTHQCPKDVKDIEVIKALARAYDKNPHPVDFSELIAFPLNPASSRIEPHLPVSCGFNEKTKEWHNRLNLYAADTKTIMIQGNSDYSKDSRTYELVPKKMNTFKLTESNTGDASYRDGGVTGDARFAPLGDGLFVMTFRSPQFGVFFHGLVIVPSQREPVRQACEKQQWLAQNQDTMPDSEIKETHSAIRNLLLQGQALTQARKLTEFLAKNKDRLTPANEARLRTQAQHLFNVIDGKTKEKSKLGENPDACRMLSRLVQNSASEKPTNTEHAQAKAAEKTTAAPGR